jgi:hypothetical protein
LGLGAPKFVGGNIDRAKAVSFGSIFWHSMSGVKLSSRRMMPCLP